MRKDKRYRPLFFSPADGGAGAESRWVHDRNGERAWGLKAFEALARYFELEDPRRVEPIACETRLACTFEGLPEVTGVIDRLDGAGGGSEQRVTDYKTGRAPSLKYSPASNAKIREESFFQLRLYAWMLRERGTRASELRLLYLGDGVEVTQAVTGPCIEQAAVEVRSVWARMLEALQGGDYAAHVSPLCDWCSHKESCPAWAETEPPDTGTAART